MRHAAILIAPNGEEFFDAYGPMTKEPDKAIRYVSAEIATRGAINRFGRGRNAFWNSEREAERIALQKYRAWNFRVVPETQLQTA